MTYESERDDEARGIVAATPQLSYITCQWCGGKSEGEPMELAYVAYAGHLERHLRAVTASLTDAVEATHEGGENE